MFYRTRSSRGVNKSPRLLVEMNSCLFIYFRLSVTLWSDTKISVVLMSDTSTGHLRLWFVVCFHNQRKCYQNIVKIKMSFFFSSEFMNSWIPFPAPWAGAVHGPRARNSGRTWPFILALSLLHIVRACLYQILFCDLRFNLMLPHSIKWMHRNRATKWLVLNI